MKKPPEKIYLQQSEDGWSEHGVTWCKDKINDHDVEYIRKKNYAIYVNGKKMKPSEGNAYEFKTIKEAVKNVAICYGLDSLLNDIEIKPI